MKTIQVFDPALCCSTGVCGVDADQVLINFAADYEWAKSKGCAITRVNLAQEPLVFAENEVVRKLLERSGPSALPVVLVDNEIALAGRYPTRDELAHWIGAGSSVQSNSCCSTGSPCC